MALIKPLVDTNVILDAILHRGAFYPNAKAIFDLSEQRLITGCISASAATDIFYLARKELKDADLVYRVVDTLTKIFTILPVFDTTIKTALALHWKDFEDAVQYAAALENGVNHIVTRNAADYEAGGLAINPADFLLLV